MLVCGLFSADQYLERNHGPAKVKFIHFQLIVTNWCVWNCCSIEA